MSWVSAPSPSETPAEGDESDIPTPRIDAPTFFSRPTSSNPSKPHTRNFSAGTSSRTPSIVHSRPSSVYSQNNPSSLSRPQSSSYSRPASPNRNRLEVEEWQVSREAASINRLLSLQSRLAALEELNTRLKTLKQASVLALNVPNFADPGNHDLAGKESHLPRQKAALPQMFEMTQHLPQPYNKESEFTESEEYERLQVQRLQLRQIVQAEMESALLPNLKGGSAIPSPNANYFNSAVVVVPMDAFNPIRNDKEEDQSSNRRDSTSTFKPFHSTSQPAQSSDATMNSKLDPETNFQASMSEGCNDESSKELNEKPDTSRFRTFRFSSLRSSVGKGQFTRSLLSIASSHTKSENELEQEVESRVCHMAPVDLYADQKPQEPKTLQDAVEKSMPYLMGGFSRESLTRIVCFNIYKSPLWDTFFIAVNLAYCIVLTTVPEAYLADFNNYNSPTDPNSGTNGPGPYDLLEYASLILLMIETLAGCIAIGFVGSKTSWLQNSYFHKIDFAVLAFSCLDYLLHYVLVKNLGLPKGPFRVFRLFRLLRPMMKLKSFIDIKRMLVTLSRGSGQLVTVFVVLIFFLLAFSLFGMAILKGSFRRRCVTLDHYVPSCITPIDENGTNWNMNDCNLHNSSAVTLVPGGDIVRVGGYPFQRFCKIFKNTTAGEFDGIYPMDGSGVYHNCDMETFLAGGAVKQTCAAVGNPQGGMQHFDNLGGTLLVLIQYSVPDRATDPLHAALESEPESAVLIWAYFLLVSLLITFIMLGLVLAVITGTFKVNSEKRNSVMPLPSQIDLEVRKSLRLTEANSGEAILQQWAKEILANPRFEHAKSIVILIHSAAMSADAAETPQDVISIVDILYIVANGLFGADVVLRYIADGGYSQFLKNFFHVFDSLLVVAGISGVIMRSKILVLLPVLRMYQLIQYLPTMYALLLNLVRANKIFVQLFLFTALNTLAFAVLGRYLFRAEMNECTRSNYSNLGQSLLTTFQIFTGDTWSEILYCGLESLEGEASHILTSSYVIGWLFGGKVILYDFYVVVIIVYFKVSDTIEMIHKPGRIQAWRTKMQLYYAQFFHSISQARNNKIQSSDVKLRDQQFQLQGLRAKLSSNRAAGAVLSSKKSNDSMHAGIVNKSVKRLLSAAASNESLPSLSQNQMVEDDGDNDRAFAFLQRSHPLREMCSTIKDNFIFKGVIYFAVICSCVLVMSMPPAPDIPNEHVTLSLDFRKACDQVLLGIFAAELLICTTAQGLLLSKNAYLRSWWNVLDFSILFFSVLDQSGLLSGQVEKVFRLGRALRPLRLIKRNTGLRVLTEALVCTLLPVSYVIGLTSFATTMFAVIGKGIFGGKLFRCTYGVEYPQGKVECSGLFVDPTQGVLYPKAWINPTYHFDSFYQATLTLVRVLTLKFSAILTDAMDVTEANVNLHAGFSPNNAWFIVIYIVIGPIIIMNLLIAFICGGFNVYRKSTEVDVHFSKFCRQIEHNIPTKLWFKPPSNDFSKAARAFTATARFQAFSIVCVGVNICFLLADHADASDSFNSLMDAQNFVFFLELAFEVALNLLGYGPGGIVDDLWKGFDFLVLVGTTIGYLSSSRDIALFSKVQIELKSRSYKTKIMILFDPGIPSLPSHSADEDVQGSSIIHFLVVQVYSIFAAVFVQIFGLTKYGSRIGGTANFESFTDSMFVIYQMVIGDEWMLIMDDAAVQPPFCTERFDANYIWNYTGPDYSFGDCGSNSSRFLFVLFKLVCESMMLNLFIGVVLENFGFITDEISDREDPTWRLGPSNKQILELKETFESYSAMTGQISVDAAATSLLYSLSIPIGFRTPSGEFEYEDIERAAQKLIRAELNVILLQNRIRAESDSVNLQWLWSLYLFRSIRQHTAHIASRNFINGVNFQNTMMVLAHWRKSTLIPDAIKQQRRQRLEDVVMMYCALVVTDFFRTLVSRRKFRQVYAHVQKKVLLKRWMDADYSCRRRTDFYAQVREEETNFAQSCRKDVSKVRSPVSNSVLVQGTKYSEISSNLCFHHDAVLLKIQCPKSVHGLDVFKKLASQQAVVIQFKDVLHAHHSAYKLDLRNVDWKGWQLSSSEEDSFFRPYRLSANIRKTPTIWDAFEFEATDSDGVPIVWTILDLQSFVFLEEKYLRSVLRLNLGSKNLVDQQMDVEQREMLFACTAEVLGYVPFPESSEPAGTNDLPGISKKADSVDELNVPIIESAAVGQTSNIVVP